MFLEDRDYKVVCNDDTLDIISQSDEQTRRDAERSAQEEVEGYDRANAAISTTAVPNTVPNTV